jgi:hypothetical protein
VCFKRKYYCPHWKNTPDQFNTSVVVVNAEIVGLAPDIVVKWPCLKMSFADTGCRSQGRYKSAPAHGCQMVYLQTKNTNFIYFRRPSNGNFWYIS